MYPTKSRLWFVLLFPSLASRRRSVRRKWMPKYPPKRSRFSSSRRTAQTSAPKPKPQAMHFQGAHNQMRTRHAGRTKVRTDENSLDTGSILGSHIRTKENGIDQFWRHLWSLLHPSSWFSHFYFLQRNRSLSSKPGTNTDIDGWDNKDEVI